MSFRDELLFVKWIDSDDYYGAKRAWVGDCPDGVDPRSEANDLTFTYEETLESSWGEEPREQWAIVACRRPEMQWVGVDVDGDEEHAETVPDDVTPEDVRAPDRGVVMAKSKSGWPHVYCLARDPPAVDGIKGVDILGESGEVSKRVAISPWHDDRREVIREPELEHAPPVDMSGWIRESLEQELKRFVSMETDDGLVDLVERATHEHVDVDAHEAPKEAPGSVPQCIRDMFTVRTTEARYDYPDSPYAADNHLAMLIWAAGYSKDEALGMFADNPPAKETGFDREITEKQLDGLWPKLNRGEVYPPTKKLGIDVSGCTCPMHSDGDVAFEMPTMRENVIDSHGSRADAAVLSATQRRTEAVAGSPVEGAQIVKSPQGMGKTWHTSAGAGPDNKVLHLLPDKQGSRDTAVAAAEEHGVDYHVIRNFSESWLASDASPVQREVLGLYHRGASPSHIREKFADRIPDDVADPYMEQFDGPIEADLVIGTAGHENVSHFRNIEYDDGVVHRSIVRDDCAPAEMLEETSFSTQGRSDELNAVTKHIDHINATEWTAVRDDPEQRDRLRRTVVGTGDADEREEHDDVFEALDAAADRTDALAFDLIGAMMADDELDGDSLMRLKVACGVEIDSIHSTSLERRTGAGHVGDVETLHAWTAAPRLDEHDVAVMTGTPMPHVTEEWFESVGHDDVETVDVCSDWRAARRAMGWTVVQTNDASNSRSGIGPDSYYADETNEARTGRTMDLRDAIARKHGEAPKMIDSKGAIDVAVEEHGLERDDTMHHAIVESNNRFREETVGLVAGSTYYGDDYVLIRAAYVGENATITHEAGAPTEIEGEKARDIMRHMRCSSVGQAIARFGRDGQGATVYVDSCEIPETWPTIDVSGEVRRFNETEREVMAAINDGAQKMEELSEQVGVSRRQISNVVWQLESEGILEIERHALEFGAHRVDGSGSSDITITVVDIPDTGGEGCPDAGDDDQTGRQSTLDGFEQQKYSQSGAGSGTAPADD